MEDYGGTFVRRMPGIQINVLAIYPNALPPSTELGLHFTQLQKHKSFMHDWKK